MLAHAKEHDEVVLWFEQDLFCATNLWFVLDRLEAARVSLVFPPLSAGAGLGALTPDTFEPLFERRRALTAADIADARALWRAYAAPEPLSLTRLQPTLPFAPAAVGLHCARFPSVVDGLDDVEHATLGALDDPLAFGALFRRVTRSAELSELAPGRRPVRRDRARSRRRRHAAARDRASRSAVRGLARLADIARRRRARRPRRPPPTGAARPLAPRRAPAPGCAALALGPRAPHARGGVSLARRATPPAGYTRRRAREDRTVAGRGNTAGGKSGLRRAGCWLTARGGNPTESATETYRRRKAGKGETVR